MFDSIYSAPYAAVKLQAHEFGVMAPGAPWTCKRNPTGTFLGRGSKSPRVTPLAGPRCLVPQRGDTSKSCAILEPLVLGEGSRHRAELTDLALELAQRSAGFRRSLPESLLSSLATLVRAMNWFAPGPQRRGRPSCCSRVIVDSKMKHNLRWDHVPLPAELYVIGFL